MVFNSCFYEITNFGKLAESRSGIYVPLRGIRITFQFHRWLPECSNNIFEEGFSRDLKISKCFLSN